MKMFVEPGAVYLHREAVDFRKSINGLVAIVEQKMNRSTFVDAVFVFCNRTGGKLGSSTGIKPDFTCGINAWNRSASNGRHAISDAIMPLSEEQFNWFLSGYDVIGHQPLRYSAIA